MSEHRNGKFLDLHTLETMGVDTSSFHPDFLEWYGQHGGKIKCRLMLEGLADSGADGTAGVVELNSLFAACEASNPSSLHVSDTKRNGRYNVNARWRIRDILRERKNWKAGNTDPLLGGNYYQFGSVTHEVVGKLMLGQLPPGTLQPSFFDEEAIDEDFLQQIESCLIGLEAFPVNGESTEELVELQRPMVDKLHVLLPRIFGPYLKVLKDVRIPKVQYASSLFLRSWGYAALKYIREPELRSVFREITFPQVAVFDDGQKLAPGKADGLWVETVDGCPPDERESFILRNLAKREIRTFAELTYRLELAFKGRSLQLGLWEMKSLGDKERGFLQAKEVEAGPRPDDLIQVRRYAALGNKYLLDNPNFSMWIGRMEILYLLLQPPMAFCETMDAEGVEAYLLGLKEEHEIYKKRASLRQREGYALREIIKKLNGVDSRQPQSLFSLLTEAEGKSI